MCTQVNTHHSCDIVGSFLRSNKIKEARAALNLKKITPEDLKKMEDEEIIRIVEKQKELGFTVISDGEFRRSYWHLDFFWGFDGVEHNHMGTGYLFHGEETRDDSARLNGRIKFSTNHPFLNEFKFLNQIVGNGFTARQSIPAPAQFYAELVRGRNEEKVNEFYPNRAELFKDIAHAYNDAIWAFYHLGCRDLKLDDCTWGMLCDENFWKNMAGSDYNVEELKDLYLKLNNDSLQNLPDDLLISTHVCRGNYHSTWATSGGYEPIAAHLFAKEHVNTFFLEFDDERSGDFAPLRFIPKNKNVVLGLVTSKKPQLEDKKVIIERIKQATQYISLDRLSLSPQCGFASTEEGNILTEADQWKKLQLIHEISVEVWGKN